MNQKQHKNRIMKQDPLKYAKSPAGIYKIIIWLDFQLKKDGSAALGIKS